MPSPSAPPTGRAGSAATDGFLWQAKPISRLTTPESGVRISFGRSLPRGSKPARLETGAVIQVPFFLNEGDVVKVDTRSGEYLGRVATSG